MFVEKQIAQERYNTCKTCENFFSFTSICAKCGCFMKFKVKLEAAECPVKLWPKTR